MRYEIRAAARIHTTLISAAVAACFASTVALANPTGPTVVNGTVSVAPTGNVLQITNTPNAIINWQSFSIGAGEITRFLQQSASSAVLNRVTTQNPSTILGALQSNGRVFLINPSGILFGAGAQVDVAGLVASSLNLSDADFLAGRLRFTAIPGAGPVINQGNITTGAVGNVYLVGPAVANSGIITSPQGEVVLAAGNTVELVNPGTPYLRVEITAPDNQAINLGQIIADSGRIGIYAGLIKNSGTIRANSAVVTESGQILLKATKGVTVEPGSVIQASGVQGGSISLETETDTIRVAGQLDATGSKAAGGSINLTVGGGPGGIELTTGLNAGNAAVNIKGTGHTTTLSGDTITAGAPISILDSVILGAPATITLDTTNGGAVASGANITITGTTNDDATPSALVLRAGTSGSNSLGGAVGNTAPIASLVTSGNTTFINGGLVNTTGNQTYDGAVTLGTATTLAATGVAGNIAINTSLSGIPNSLTINAGGDLTIGGNVFSGPQLISAAGDITVTPGSASSVSVFAVGPQTVSAGGSLSVQGAATGSNRFAQFTTTGDQNFSASGITITGGSGTNNFAQINHQAGSSGNQTITVNNGGTLLMQGGLGGADNFARIRSDVGAQNVAFPAGGNIVITGGNGPDVAPDPLDTANNFARIENRSLTGLQTVNTGTITLNGAVTGTNNFTGIQAAHQVITTSGDVTLSGGPAENSGSRIGAVGNTSPTDLVLNVGGNLTLNGGSVTGGSIGSNREGGQPTDIRVVAAGDVTLNPGSNPGANPRIGSPSENIAGGNIFVGAGAGKTIALSSAGPGFGTEIRTTGNVTLLANSITQGADSSIVAGSLGVGTLNGASLGGANQVSLFSLFNSSSGEVLFNNASPLLTVAYPVSPFTAISQVPTGTLTLNQAGDLAITSNVLSGPQSINVTGNMVVGSPNNSVNVSATGTQSVNVGGMLTLQGAPSSTNRFARLTATGDQSITAAGITLAGGSGTNNFADIRQTDFGANQAITVTGGGSLTMQGGLGGTDNFARIRNDGIDQHINFPAGGNIVITGGNGPDVAPDPLDTANNFARIENRSLTGLQTVNTGTITLNGAVTGTNNFTGIQAAHQVITTSGDVTLSGGPAENSGSRIGAVGNTSPTDLVLNVGGNLTLNGGSVTGGSIGSNREGGQPTNITVVAGGDIVLNPNSSAGGTPRIGSPSENVAGGDIFLSASGNIELNSAGPGHGTGIFTLGNVVLGTLTPGKTITQGPDSVIRADGLSVTANGDISLVGANQAVIFNGAAGLGGNLSFNNAAPALTVPGLTLFGGGTFTLNQAGNLFITGDVSSGPQTIAATGDIMVAPFGGPGASLVATGPQSISAGGSLLVQGGTATGGTAKIISTGPVTINAGHDLTLSGGSGEDARAKLKGEAVHASVGGDLTLAGGSGKKAQALLFGRDGVDLTVGGALRLDAGSGPNAWAKVQTGSPHADFTLYFPNLESGGYFVNGIEGMVMQGQTGFFTDEQPARLGDTLITTYSE